MSKVKVRNTLNHEVFVYSPDLNFRRSWPTIDSVVSIEQDTLDELMNDIGFRNMIDSGILYIDDMQVKKELGIEPEDATEPENVIVLSNKDKEMYLKALGLTAFKEKVSKLNRTQLEELCDYAVDKKIANIDKAKILKELCGKDIIKAISLVDSQEDEK